MQKEIIIKNINEKYIASELKEIGFDKEYISCAEEKYTHYSYKIFNLKPHEANILKQTCLSLGFDCGVNRDVVTCKCEYSDAVFSSTKRQLKELIAKLNQQPFRLKEIAKYLEKNLFNRVTNFELKDNRNIDLNKTNIMGILNVTPDSFSDGGLWYSTEKAVEHGFSLISEGADIIDIGGESTRPGAETVAVEEELKRVIPVIEKIREHNKNIPISIDTRNYKTAYEAVFAGADIINDVSGLDYDEKLKEFVCTNNLPAIIMHSDKVPAFSSELAQDSPYDAVEEIYKNLFEKTEELKKCGLNESNIIIDPGIGFGKSANDSFEIIKRIEEFKSLNFPILMGTSRKSFIKNTFSKTNYDIDEISTIIDSYMALKGIQFLRVHNVEMHKKYLDIISKLI